MADILVESDVPLPMPGGRPAGTLNVLPDADTQRKWLRKLREDADMGDPAAMGWLLLLARMNKDGLARKDTAARLLDAIA